MDVEIAALAITATALLSGLVTRLIVKPESPILTGSRQLETVEHVHEYNHLVDGKWACAHCEALRPE